MSLTPLPCDACGVDRVLDQIGPFGDKQTYAGTVWRCPTCGSTAMDIYPILPLVPVAGGCPNCGSPAHPDAPCPACGWPPEYTSQAVAGQGPPTQDAVASLMRAGLVRRAQIWMNHALPGLAPADALPLYRARLGLLTALGYRTRIVELVEALPDPPAALLFTRARTLQELGRVAEAAEAYALVAARVGDDVRIRAAALRNGGNALVACGRASEAEVALQEAMALEPGEPAFLQSYLAFLYAQQRWADLYEAAGRAADRLPAQRASLLALRAEALLELNRPEEALVQTNALLAEAPSDVHGLYNRGRALAVLGRPIEADACMVEVLKQEPDNGPARRAHEMLAPLVAAQKARPWWAFWR